MSAIRFGDVASADQPGSRDAGTQPAALPLAVRQVTGLQVTGREQHGCWRLTSMARRYRPALATGLSPEAGMPPGTGRA
jgi:hypothetical protein